MEKMFYCAAVVARAATAITHAAALYVRVEASITSKGERRGLSKASFTHLLLPPVALLRQATTARCKLA